MAETLSLILMPLFAVGFALLGIRLLRNEKTNGRRRKAEFFQGWFWLVWAGILMLWWLGTFLKAPSSL